MVEYGVLRLSLRYVSLRLLLALSFQGNPIYPVLCAVTEKPSRYNMQQQPIQEMRG